MIDILHIHIIIHMFLAIIFMICPIKILHPDLLQPVHLVLHGSLLIILIIVVSLFLVQWGHELIELCWLSVHPVDVLGQVAVEHDATHGEVQQH